MAPRSNFAGDAVAIRFADDGMCLFGTRESHKFKKVYKLTKII
jgi:hypothetical protein